MNYLLKSKPKSTNRIKVISIISLFLLLSLSAFLFPNALRGVAYYVSRPLWATRDFTVNTIGEVSDFFISKSSLVAETISLRAELADLKLKEVDYDALSKENQDLQNQLGRKDSTDTIISRVLSRPPLSPYDTFVIDVGSTEGVAVDSKVYYSDNIIIGSVVSVTSNTSLVKLFSSGNEKQEATLERTGASFILSGLGGSNLELEVPKDTDILWGDVFTYPGIKPSVIGSVYYIDDNSQSAFKTVYIRVPGNMFSAQWLFVEKTQ